MGMVLLIDAGSGIIPVNMAGANEVLLLMTHHHHDHTQGLPLWGTTYNKKIPISVIGPVQEGCGPADVFQTIMKKPFFPVQFEAVSSHFTFYPLGIPSSFVIVCHQQGGFLILKNAEFERMSSRISFGRNGNFSLDECLIISMHKTDHPESTISYRFEERRLDKVFIFLTDHENQDGIPKSFREHLSKADLLIEDTQYDRQTYESMTAGYGHATPDYAVRVSNAVGVRRLGLTHHDPKSDDTQVEAILAEARRCAQDAIDRANAGEKQTLLAPDQIFACADYMEIDV